jgi:hypothetical protein
MTIGLRALLLLVAAVLFLVAALSDENQGDLLAIGLMVMALGFVVDDLGLGRFTTRRDRA